MHSLIVMKCKKSSVSIEVKQGIRHRHTLICTDELHVGEGVRHYFPRVDRQGDHFLGYLRVLSFSAALYPLDLNVCDLWEGGRWMGAYVGGGVPTGR